MIVFVTLSCQMLGIHCVTSEAININTYGSCSSADGKLEKEIDDLEDRVIRLESFVASLQGDSTQPYIGPRGEYLQIIFSSPSPQNKFNLLSIGGT